MRYVVTLLAYIAALAITVVAMYFAVMILAGPHGGLLPNALHGAMLALGWLVVIVVPLLAARWTWRRLSRSP